MINWESGQVIEGEYIDSGMYVNIIGIRYPIMMPQVQGKTPLTAENLNKNQENLLEFEVDEEW